MKKSILGICCLTSNNVMAQEGGMPWMIPEDLAFFRKMTMHQRILMGRITYQHLPVALDGRRMSVISSSPRAYSYACRIGSLEEIDNFTEDRVFVIGGARLFSSMRDKIDLMLVTRILGEIEGDLIFSPESIGFDKRAQTAWSESRGYLGDRKNPAIRLELWRSSVQKSDSPELGEFFLAWGLTAGTGPDILCSEP